MAVRFDAACRAAGRACGFFGLAAGEGLLDTSPRPRLDLRLSKQACAECHDNPHGDQFAWEMSQGGCCHTPKSSKVSSFDHKALTAFALTGTCHSALGWKATRPLEIHRMTRFPLTGMHVLADCSECHRSASEQRWTGAPIDCFACHEKEIRRAELRPVHVGTAATPPFSRDCSQCHRALAWVPALPIGPLVGAASSPLRVAPPGHDLRFPISFGMHHTASCDDCHATLATPRAVR